MIYFAHPIYALSTEAEQQIFSVKAKLYDAYVNLYGKIELYDPKDLKITNEYGMSLGEWSACVFHSDIRALDMCDTVVLTDFGRHMSCGTAFEVGYAFAKNKRIIIIDMPNTTEMSVMVHNCGTNRTSYEAFMKLSRENVVKFMNEYRADRLKSKVEQH